MSSPNPGLVIQAIQKDMSGDMRAVARPKPVFSYL